MPFVFILSVFLIAFFLLLFSFRASRESSSHARLVILYATCSLKKNYSILLVLFLFAILVVVGGCGSRKEVTERQIRQKESILVQFHPELISRLNHHGFPRLMNQLQECCLNSKTKQLFDEIYLWDLVILNAESPETIPEYVGPSGIIRRQNPNAVILGYFSGGDTIGSDTRHLQNEFNKALQDRWYLRDTKGKIYPLYHLRSGEWTKTLNVTTEVNRFLPQYLSRTVLRESALDGIFYDWASTSISYLNRRNRADFTGIDIDNDGRADKNSEIDKLWIEGWLNLLRNSRIIFPEGTLIVGNGGWGTGMEYAPELNGIMIEQFLKGARSNPQAFGWGNQMRTYSYYQNHSLKPQLSIVMANDNNKKDFEKVRFALASTLMFDGYFCFTNATGAYSNCRWYDEYSVDLDSGSAERRIDAKGYLGRPLAAAFNVQNRSQELEPLLYSDPNKAQNFTWRRDFENGIVLVNPGSTTENVFLGGSFRKIRGSVDPLFNDGSVIDQIALSPGSGVILLRTQ